MVIQWALENCGVAPRKYIDYFFGLVARMNMQILRHWYCRYGGS